MTPNKDGEMKVKQEIIAATYSIEKLTLHEFNLIKEGLYALIADDYGFNQETARGKSAREMLDKLE